MAASSPAIALDGFPTLLTDLLTHHLTQAGLRVVAVTSSPAPRCILRWVDESTGELVVDDPHLAITIVVADTPVAARRWRHRSAAAIGAREVDIGSFLDLVKARVLGGKARPVTKRGAASPSDRELEVMELVANGCATEEIAATLGISPHTVRTHIRQVIGKLGVSSRAAAVVQLTDEGLISSHPASPA